MFRKNGMHAPSLMYVVYQSGGDTGNKFIDENREILISGNSGIVR